MKGGYVTLSKLTFEDSHFCVSLRNSTQGKYLNLGSKNIEDQNRWLVERPKNEYNYLISDKDGAKIGIIALVDIDMTKKQAEPARFVMLPDISRRNNKLIFEPLFLIYQLSFENFKLERLQGVIARPNERMIKLQQYLGMEIDGVMKKQRIINNKLEDLIVLSLSKERYLDYTKKLFSSLLT